LLFDFFVLLKIILSRCDEANNDRLKNNILTYINRFIETFDENVYMKIHLQCEFCRICALDDYLREILSPNFTQ